MVAQELYNQPTQKGGLMGGLTGGIGGALLGAATAAIPGVGLPLAAGFTALGALGGGLYGALSPSGAGGSLLKSGAMLSGGIAPRSTATNKDIRDIDFSLLEDNDFTDYGLTPSYRRSLFGRL